MKGFSLFTVLFLLLFQSNTVSSQILTYTNDSSGALASVATYATGTPLSRVNGATRPGTPCTSGYSATSFTTVTTYSSSLPAVEVSVSPNTSYTLNVTGFSVDLRRSPTGPANARLAYSTDGGVTWTDQGTDQFPNNATCDATTTATWTTSFTVSSPLSLKFRVYGFNASGLTGTLQILNLIINGTVTTSTGCGTPSGLSASAITTSSATLSWASVSGASSYDIRYRPVGSTTWTTTTSGTTSVAVSGLATCTNYEFQVQAVCSSLGSYSASTTFTTLSTSCGTPAGLSAASVTSSSATLNWTAVSGATSYNIHYRPSGTTTWSTTTSATTSVAVSGLTPGTIYEYQVQAVCGCGPGSYTASSYFTTTTVSTSSSSGKMTIYFNAPVNTTVSTGVSAVYLHNCMADTLVAYINRAHYSIDIAQYDYNQSSGFANIATAINNAYLAGKTIRWIYDGSQPNTGIALLNPGIHTLASPTTSAYGIMHNKFVIIDANSTSPNDAIVCTGSEDWGVTQFNQDPNNIVFIQDSALAHAYTNEFNMMWGSTTAVPNPSLSKFGPYKTDLGAHTFHIGGNLVELYFSPSDHTNTHIQSTINSANTDLYFGVYDFTESPDATSIVSRHTAGVYTLGIVDQYSTSGSAYPVLTSGLGTLMKTYTSSSTVYHNKMLIVDPSNTCSDPLVLTGSHNWTVSADTKNDENTLIIHNDTVANIYYQSFYANYAALSGTLSAIPPCTITTCGDPTGLSATSITTTSAVLNWTGVSGAISYNIRYRPTGTTTWSTTTSSTTSVTVTGLTPATTYEFQVETVCGSSTSAYTASVNFTTLALPCTVPTGLTVTGVTSTSATLNWIAVSGAVSYNIQYRPTGTTTWSTTTSATNTVTISGLTPGTTYEFQVQVVCSSSTSAFSSSATFTTPAITCSVPTGLAATSISTTSESLSWSAVTGAVSYSVHYRPVGTSGWSYTTSAGTSLTLTGLTPGTSYEFQVQAICSSADSSGYSSSTVFTTTGSTTAITGTANEDVDMTVYPNPVMQNVTVAWHLSAAAKVDVALYNIVGQEVSHIVLGDMQQPGIHTYTLPVSAPGVYFVKLTVDNSVFVKKIVRL